MTIVSGDAVKISAKVYGVKDDLVLIRIDGFDQVMWMPMDICEVSVKAVPKIKIDAVLGIESKFSTNNFGDIVKEIMISMAGQENLHRELTGHVNFGEIQFHSDGKGEMICVRDCIECNIEQQSWDLKEKGDDVDG